MSTFLWLKNRDCVAGYSGKHFDVRTGLGPRGTEAYFISVSDPCDPTRFMLSEEILQNVVHVTCRTTITRCLRKDGVYRNGMAELVAKTEISFGDGQNVSVQELNICAPTINDVDWIYSLFRKGQLEPEENWEPKDVDDAVKTAQRDEVQKCAAEIRAFVSELRGLLPGLKWLMQART